MLASLLPAMIAEYDASLLTYAQGATVDRWPEANGKGYDLLQAAAGLRPTMQTTAFGGRACARFDAVDDVILSAAIGENMPLIHSMYVAFQHVTAAPAAFKNPLFVFSPGSNWHTIAQSAGITQHIAEITRAAGAQQFQRARLRVARTLVPQTWGQTYTGSGVVTGLHALYGGMQDIESTIAAIGVPAGALATPQVQTPANVPFNIDVAHMVLFNRQLTALENALFHAYLTARCGVLNVSSDIIPTGPGTVFGVGAPGGPGASISVGRPTGSGSSVALVFMLNLSRNSADPIYTITPPAGVTRLVEVVNDQVFFGIYGKNVGAFPGGEPASYLFGISPATINGGDIHCDALDGVRLTPPGPFYLTRTYPKGSGFSGSPVTTTDWNIALPGAPMLTRWIVKVGSDGRISVPGSWTVPAHYLEDTAIAAASSFQRRSGGTGGRTDAIAPNIGAMGVVGAVALVSAAAAFDTSSRRLRLRGRRLAISA